MERVEREDANAVAMFQSQALKPGRELADRFTALMASVVSVWVLGIDVYGLIQIVLWVVKVPRENVLVGNPCALSARGLSPGPVPRYIHSLNVMLREIGHRGPGSTRE